MSALLSCTSPAAIAKASDPGPDFDPFRDVELAVEYLPIKRVKRYRRNARTHSKEQIGKIAASIRAFGFVSPLVVDAEDELIAGHGRLEAALLLKIEEVPVVRANHLDAAQRAALRITDNRLAELSGWDKELLALEFGKLLEIDLSSDLTFDLAITGFAPAEIDGFVSASREEKKDDPEEMVPEPDRKVPAVTQRGDIFLLGDHKIICGDSRSPLTYSALMGDERAAMGIHDAPYNVSVTRHVSRSGKHNEFAMGVGEMSKEEFTSFLADFMTHACAFSAPGAVQWTFMDWRHMAEMLEAGLRARLELKNLAVWNKGAGAMGSLLRSQHELVFMFKEPGAPHKNNVCLGKYGRNRTNVWDFPGSHGLRKELELHPTPKPVSLVAEAIKDVSDRNDIVLDAFSGSGTTIIACARTGRRARVIELDPHYVDVAIERWQRWSGEAARHHVTGSSFDALKEQRREVAAGGRSATEDEPQAGGVRVRSRQRTP